MTEKLTRERILGMESGAEIDEFVARLVMGWVKCGYDTRCGHFRENLLGACWCKSDFTRTPFLVSDHTHDLASWQPSRDKVQAIIVEDEIERRGWEEEFLLNLMRVIFGGVEDDPFAFLPCDLWRMMRATPLQVCQAALLTLLEMKGRS